MKEVPGLLPFVFRGGVLHWRTAHCRRASAWRIVTIQLFFIAQNIIRNVKSWSVQEKIIFIWHVVGFRTNAVFLMMKNILF